MGGVQKVITWVRTSPAVDKAAGALAEAVPAALRRREVTDLLGARALGRPVHPAVVALPIGLYAASAALDLMPGSAKAARAVIGAGLAVAPAALATELAEYGTLDEKQRRTAFVQLAANAAANVCYLTSFRLRGHGFGVVARAVSALGLAALGAGGLLGVRPADTKPLGGVREPV
ncbi:hypothetical protein FHX81_3127 [Saccharothrix saharensis]|uniref:DUF2231 domain-containing protein n=1 Tax=Saccharothrix saharensis TaxID=571190 RepID=A0A543JD49_9PSEU|nr:DUF2231 domain-containing protein [Saccharothrix saharensis]TQM80779.1 hypothetical protein FHX81_3127 [Saccharothrix saharensis]